MSIKAINPNASTEDVLIPVIKTNHFDNAAPTKFNAAWARYNIAKDLFYERLLMFGFFGFIAAMVILFVYCGL